MKPKVNDVNLEKTDHKKPESSETNVETTDPKYNETTTDIYRGADSMAGNGVSIEDDAAVLEAGPAIDLVQHIDHLEKRIAALEGGQVVVKVYDESKTDKLPATVEDLDAALLRLPATPKTDEDLNARAALMARRIELDQAAKATAEANRQPRPRGNLVVNVPTATGTTNYYSHKGRIAQSRMAEDGRVVLDLFVDEFKSLLMGRDGLIWQNCNPEVMRALGQT